MSIALAISTSAPVFTRAVAMGSIPTEHRITGMPMLLGTSLGFKIPQNIINSAPINGGIVESPPVRDIMTNPTMVPTKMITAIFSFAGLNAESLTVRDKSTWYSSALKEGANRWFTKITAAITAIPRGSLAII